MPPSGYLMGAVQMTSTADRAKNLDVALRLVNEAADLGAKLVGLPENFAYMGPEEGRLPGDKVVVAPTALGRIGLTVCYDLRFPELYRKLASLGAEVLTIPSAFTLFTGKDHWEVLVRARAVENLAYVMAPAQVGRHSSTRQTFGNAMIVDPWGVVLARCPDGEGVCVAPFSRARLERVRAELPALKHRKLNAVITVQVFTKNVV